MKTLFCILAMGMCALGFARQPQRSVMVETGGASFRYGLSFDSRFSHNNSWGYRVGLVYKESPNANIFVHTPTRTLAYGTAAMIQGYRLVGGTRHSLELGAGMHLGYFKYCYTTASEDVPPSYIIDYHKGVGYDFHASVGYRFQMQKGIVVRVGNTTASGLGGKHGIFSSPKVLAPYLSFGVSF